MPGPFFTEKLQDVKKGKGLLKKLQTVCKFPVTLIGYDISIEKRGRELQRRERELQRNEAV
ncbi:hypothetical protein EFM19_00910 [Lactobacillus delbrueckii]|nr:hypothetical protein [Lactobacillus delbrueckii]